MKVMYEQNDIKLYKVITYFQNYYLKYYLLDNKGVITYYFFKQKAVTNFKRLVSGKEMLKDRLRESILIESILLGQDEFEYTLPKFNSGIIGFLNKLELLGAIEKKKFNISDGWNIWFQIKSRGNSTQLKYNAKVVLPAVYKGTDGIYHFYEIGGTKVSIMHR